MARKTPPDPFAAHAWLLEAGWVFMMHSAQVLTDPARAATRLAALGAEKQRAFAEGAIQASAAMLRGARPDLVAQAAMAPSRRRVRANARKIPKPAT
jgi:hypothetical protein